MAGCSPFTIPAETVKVIENCENIKAVGAFLERQEYKFCQAHSCLPLEIQSTFTLHRDILHAVLLPVLQICGQAAHFANSVLIPYQPPPSTRPAVDLELAFRGQARSAFSWLQCFLSHAERDWALTKGCPACIVLRILHDEPFIRIVVAACRVSSYLQSVFESHGSPANLPDFTFWLTAVRHAVTEDPFWGLHFWSEIEVRAISLSSGIQELVSQCLFPATKVVAQRAAPNRSVSNGASLTWAQGVQNGKIVKREMKLKQEEEQWMKDAVESCCSILLTEAARKRNLVSVRRWQEQGKPKSPRRRSLTT